jgi:hypothetical protein
MTGHGRNERSVTVCSAGRCTAAVGRELATDSFGSGRSVATLSAASVRARQRLLSSDVDLCLEVRERPVIGVDRSLNRKIAAVAFGSIAPPNDRYRQRGAAALGRFATRN